MALHPCQFSNSRKGLGHAAASIGNERDRGE
jgi:hypothetical protein